MDCESCTSWQPLGTQFNTVTFYGIIMGFLPSTNWCVWFCNHPRYKWQGLFCQFTGGSGGYINCINYSHNSILISNYVNLCQSMSIYIKYIYIYKTGGQNTGGIAIPCAGLRRLAAKPWCWARKNQPNMPSRVRLKQERCGTGDRGWGWLGSMNFMGCEWMVLGVRNGFLTENPHGQKVEFLYDGKHYQNIPKTMSGMAWNH